MSANRSTFTVLSVIALLVPGASAPLTASGSMLFIENAGQWPDAARFQVLESPLGEGTTWLADDAIWLVRRSLCVFKPC